MSQLYKTLQMDASSKKSNVVDQPDIEFKNLTFSPNFQPPTQVQRKFEYFPNSRIVWFKFTGELEGCASTTAELAEHL